MDRSERGADIKSIEEILIETLHEEMISVYLVVVYMGGVNC